MITFKEFGEQALPPPPPPAGVAPVQPAPLTPEQIEQQQQQLRIQQGLAALTGSKLDKIIVNPEEKPTKFQTEETLLERVVNLIQRRRRAIALKRRMPKMRIKRKILQTRMASNQKLNQRAMRMAKQNLRKKIAGARGAKYNKLSTAEKINIDNRLKGREAQIRNIARKMMPTVRKGEQRRLRAVQTGKSTKGVYGNARNINSEYIPIYSNLIGEQLNVEDINQVFSMLEGIVSAVTAPIRGAAKLTKAAAVGVYALQKPETTNALAAGLATAGLNKLSNLGKAKPSNPKAPNNVPSGAQKELQKQAVIQSKQKTELGKIALTKAKQSLNPKDQQKADQDKANALGDIKKTVTQKIGDFNRKNKGKAQINTYSKVGSMPAKQTPAANTASSIIIPQTYKTKTPNQATTIVSHKEWDYESYLQEKADAALAKKAEKYGVTFEEVKNVFEQGLAEYDGRDTATPHQFAMQRVNSHLAEGGLWANIHAKRERIAHGSGEKMRKPGSKGAPTKQNFIDAQEAVQPKSPHDKFKEGLKKHGYDADKGADRLLNLIAKQKKEREEHEKKYAHLYSEGAESLADKIVNAGVAARKAVSDVASNFRPFDEKSYQDKVKTKKQATVVTKENVDIQELKSLTLAKYASKVREKLMNDKVDPEKKDKRKAGLDKANFKIKFGQTNESIDESFIVDRASGYSGVYTAKDLGIKMQGGFELHPSVMEEGGAGDTGTDKLTNKYKKDTPGEAVEAFARMLRAKRKANTQC